MQIFFGLFCALISFGFTIPLTLITLSFGNFLMPCSYRFNFFTIALLTLVPLAVWFYQEKYAADFFLIWVGSILGTAMAEPQKWPVGDAV